MLDAHGRRVGALCANWGVRRGRRCHAGGMANKVPEKHNAKKPGKSLKEKRADKQKKKTERRSG